MYIIHRKFLTLGLRSGIINQVHDEIVVETCKQEVDVVQRIVEEVFINPPLQEYFGFNLVVPLKVSIGVGSTWKEASL